MSDPDDAPEPGGTRDQIGEAWKAYQDRLGNLTTREENAIRRAFHAGWHARNGLNLMIGR